MFKSSIYIYFVVLDYPKDKKLLKIPSLENCNLPKNIREKHPIIVEPLRFFYSFVPEETYFIQAIQAIQKKKKAALLIKVFGSDPDLGCFRVSDPDLTVKKIGSGPDPRKLS